MQKGEEFKPKSSRQQQQKEIRIYINEMKSKEIIEKNFKDSERDVSRINLTC